MTVDNAVDPTGCGDAYRAGLMFGIKNGYDWHKTGYLASVLGSIKVESKGPQNHNFSFDEVSSRLESDFGKAV